MASSLELSVSVVLFRPDPALLRCMLDSLDVAVRRLQDANPLRAELYLVDNGGAELAEAELNRLSAFAEGAVLRGHGNVGYGSGHNLALARCRGALQLIVNADVELHPDALVRAHAFLQTHPNAGLLAPQVRGPDGAFQYLCKRYPSVLDLLLRGFAPRPLRRLFTARLARYELRDRIDPAGVEPVWDVPIVSGCFMLTRRDALEQVGGFAPAYFLYFEDFDLSLRLSEVARSVYLPSTRIIHHGGGAARKGWRHVGYFVRNGLRFFRRHGWRWR